jgi:UDP-glucose 4-epimerase
MKAFITGGAGFIASHLVDKLMDSGEEVTVFDNLSSGKMDFIKHHLDNDRFRFINGDLLNLPEVDRSISGHDIVFHFAANPDARLGIIQTNLDLNLETIATYNVLESMRKNDIKKIVFSSSGTIYGDTPIIPLSEDYGPVLPISLYGAGKVASECLISAFCGTFNMQAWIFRFANIIGDRATHGVIYDFVNKLNNDPHRLEILGDGTQEKPYLHVEDCVDGILFVLKNSNKKINLFNLGCDTSTSVSKIAEYVVEEMCLNGVEFKYSGGSRGWPGDVPQVRFNCYKINKLGWKARHTSDEAVRVAVKLIIKELGASRCKQ